jgi:hypothetical protein
MSRTHTYRICDLALASNIPLPELTAATVFAVYYGLDNVGSRFLELLEQNGKKSPSRTSRSRYPPAL